MALGLGVRSPATNYHFFSASPDDVVSALLVHNAIASPTLELRAPDGSLVTAESYTSGYTNLAYIHAHRLTQAGSYSLVSKTINYRYVISLIKCPGPNLSDDGAYTLSPGAPRIGFVDVGDMDAFTFPAIAGDSLRLTLRKLESAGELLRMDLFGPDCTIVGSVTGQTNVQLGTSCFAPQTGNYIVLVRSEPGIEPFTYVLTLTQNPVVPPSGGTNQHLAILRCTNHLILRWETNSPGFIVESTPTLRPSSWLPVNRTPAMLYNHFYLDEGEVGNLSAFYRLRCTNCNSRDQFRNLRHHGVWQP